LRLKNKNGLLYKRNPLSLNFFFPSSWRALPSIFQNFQLNSSHHIWNSRILIQFYFHDNIFYQDPLLSQIVGFIIHSMAAEKLRDLTPPIDLPLLGAIVAAFYDPGSMEQVALVFHFRHSFYFSLGIPLFNVLPNFSSLQCVILSSFSIIICLLQTSMLTFTQC